MLRKINTGKIVSEETRKKISESVKGKRVGELNPMYGVPYSEERRGKCSKTWRNKNKIKCPYCGLESIGASSMKQFHFDNCKQKPKYNV